MKMVRNREEVDPEAKVLEQIVGDNILDEAILEPMRESLRARRRRAAYAEFVNDLDDGNSDGSDDSDFDDD